MSSTSSDAEMKASSRGNHMTFLSYIYSPTNSHWVSNLRHVRWYLNTKKWVITEKCGIAFRTLFYCVKEDEDIMESVRNLRVTLTQDLFTKLRFLSALSLNLYFESELNLINYFLWFHSDSITLSYKYSNTLTNIFQFTSKKKKKNEAVDN